MGPVEDVNKQIPAFNPKDDLFDRLKAVDVDVFTGMHYCQEEPDFYQTILEQYRKESSVKKQRMADALENGILEDYATQVHAIKSSSKMIGAGKLSEKAKALEDAAKRGDMEAVKASHKDMMDLYDIVLGAIKPEDEIKEDVKESVKENPKKILKEDIEVFEFEPEGGNE